MLVTVFLLKKRGENVLTIDDKQYDNRIYKIFVISKIENNAKESKNPFITYLATKERDQIRQVYKSSFFFCIKKWNNLTDW